MPALRYNIERYPGGEQWQETVPWTCPSCLNPNKMVIRVVHEPRDQTYPGYDSAYPVNGTGCRWCPKVLTHYEANQFIDEREGGP